MVAPELGEYRDVVVFSAEHPKYEDLSESHRGDLRKDFIRQDFSMADLEAGVSYHATCTMRPVLPNLSTPRHMHDFEQIRFMVSGVLEDTGKQYGAGWLGYFPEGVFYGPQKQVEAGVWCLLQFTGPSGSRFPTRQEVRQAQRELRAAGCKFEDGICIWPDGRKQDGAEAMHTQAKGHTINYPPPRYSDQVWMNTNNFPWQPSPAPGVSVKQIGFFNQPGPAVQLLRLDPGAATPAGKTSAAMIRWIYEGEAEYHRERLPAVSNLYYPPDAPYDELRTQSGATVLSVELPTEGAEPPLPYRL
jgi:hypothetical protein